MYKPRLTQTQICNQFGYSDSTINRYRDVISMDSPYKRNKNRKKNISNSQSQTHKTSEIPKNNKNTKNINKKNT